MINRESFKLLNQPLAAQAQHLSRFLFIAAALAEGFVDQAPFELLKGGGEGSIRYDLRGSFHIISPERPDQDIQMILMN